MMHLQLQQLLIYKKNDLNTVHYNSVLDPIKGHFSHNLCIFVGTQQLFI